MSLKLRFLFLFLLGVPISIGISTTNRWGSWGEIPQFAIPMIVIFSLTHIFSIFFLLLKPITPTDKITATSGVVMFLGYSIASLLLFVSRYYYSLGYIGSYCIFSTIYVYILNWLYLTSATGRCFALAAVGNFQILNNNLDNIVLVDRPESLEHLNYDCLIIDYRAVLPDYWQRMIAEHTLNRKPILSVNEAYELFYGRVPIHPFNDDFLFSSPSRAGYLTIKRSLDISISLLLLLLFFAPFLIIILFVQVSSDGPGIFLQKRIGHNGRVFNLYKIRTMAMGADKSGAQFTMKDDPRITPIGRWLRRLRIDEWPQFWNVIKGDMSLIGPRPEQVDLAGEFAVDIPYYNLRYRVKPGITGWAQIKQGYVADREPTKKKLEYDLYYIKHIGVFLDSWILFNTLRVVLFGSGAR